MKENVTQSSNKSIMLPLSLRLDSSFESSLRELKFLFFFLSFFRAFYGMYDEDVYLFRSVMFLRQEGRHKSRSQFHLLKFGEGFPIDFATEKNDVMF